MALSLTGINAITKEHIVPRSTDVIFQASPMFTRLNARNQVRFDGGRFIQRPLMIGRLKGGASGRGETFNTDYVTIDTAAVINPKLYYVNITLYGWDDVINSGPEAVFNEVEQKFKNASLTMAEMLGTDIYLDGGNTRLSGANTGTTKMLDGLEAWLDDGNQIAAVGGITRSDLSAPGVVGNLNAYNNLSVNTFTLKAFQTAYSRAWNGPDAIDLISMSKDGFDNMWDKLQPNRRYMDKDSDVAKIGFQAFTFNNAEVVVDPYAPAQTAWGVNTKYLELYVSTNPKFQFGFTGFKENQNSIDVAGQFLYSGNLLCSNPRSGFKLGGTAL